ncbi:MAG: hypothetical protein M1814_006121 [Vezdaea aestivalis]|nr:MAG: hypothetical protein M1814_006121 [Vezdaea aestivalis]
MPGDFPVAAPSGRVTPSSQARQVFLPTTIDPDLHVRDFDRDYGNSKSLPTPLKHPNGLAMHVIEHAAISAEGDLAVRQPETTTTTYPPRKSSKMNMTDQVSSDSARSPPSSSRSIRSFETGQTSTIPPLQARGQLDENDLLEPLIEDDPRSFDLVAPPTGEIQTYSLESRSEQLFSKEHLKIIFDDPSLLLKFTAFLSSYRPESVPILIYYLDATKALKAIQYSNAVAEALEPLDGFEFTLTQARATTNSVLEDKAAQAFGQLVREDFPAYITYLYVKVVSVSITKRVTGTMAPHLREASEGLAEVFCLTDPSRPDNPIVFASEEFHRTTQYGMDYVIGRNCRFLQGPRTNPFSVKRLKDRVKAGKDHSEVFLNYRRDGSPFLNLLMVSPLVDSRGQIRYYIGAQVDVSNLVKECTSLESLQLLLEQEQKRQEGYVEDEDKDEFQELSEMLNMAELDTVRRWGGRMHREQVDDNSDKASIGPWHRPRLLLKDHSPEPVERVPLPQPHLEVSRLNGRLHGVYQNYLLIRPFPSLRILFASPSLRVPGILQSPFMARVGGTSRVREELTHALAEGRGVTAKIRWITSNADEGRSRWIHCTPLLGSNQQIGVWMVVLIDDDKDTSTRKWRQAPPVAPHNGSSYPRRKASREPMPDPNFDADQMYTARAESINSTSSPYSVRL